MKKIIFLILLLGITASCIPPPVTSEEYPIIYSDQELTILRIDNASYFKIMHLYEHRHGITGVIKLNIQDAAPLIQDVNNKKGTISIYNP